jgi:SM-20-related protein
VRSDYVLWIDERNLTPARSEYFSRIERLRLGLNRELFAGLTEFEAHYASYPPGAFYKKHVDRFGDADERVISCTLYLNQSWRADEGGALRLYFNPEDPGAFTDISPRAGVFVAFRSDTLYHEVLPASRERFSLTGWLKRRPLAPLI